MARKNCSLGLPKVQALISWARDQIEWTFGHSSASSHKIPKDHNPPGSSLRFMPHHFTSQQYAREDSFVTPQTNSNV